PHGVRRCVAEAVEPVTSPLPTLVPLLWQGRCSGGRKGRGQRVSKQATAEGEQSLALPRGGRELPLRFSPSPTARGGPAVRWGQTTMGSRSTVGGSVMTVDDSRTLWIPNAMVFGAGIGLSVGVALGGAAFIAPGILLGAGV